MTAEITPGRMESVESESWTDHLLAGSRVLGTRTLRAGGGVVLHNQLRAGLTARYQRENWIWRA